MSLPNRTDREYLLTEQYKDSSNLRARTQLHRRYSTNTYGWTRWVFDFLALLPDNSRVLEIGCGPCDLWIANLHRIPSGWQIVLSDLSPGMLQTAQDLLVSRAGRFTFREVDAQDIPFDDDSFDAVIANHMLYHLPDLDRGLSEIQRVLKPAGRLFAATNGIEHMAEMEELGRKFLRSHQIEWNEVEGSESKYDLPFNLQNGEEILSSRFTQISLRRYADSLRVTDVQPLYAYFTSSIHRNVEQKYQEAFLTFLESEMADAGGVIQIQKETGLFQAVSKAED